MQALLILLGFQYDADIIIKLNKKRIFKIYRNVNGKGAAPSNIKPCGG